MKQESKRNDKAKASPSHANDGGFEMTTRLLPNRHWYRNLLFEEGYIRRVVASHGVNEEADAALLLTWLQGHYKQELFSTKSEGQLEHTFVQPLLEFLGWHLITRPQLMIQGKYQIPDWALCLTDEDTDRFSLHPDDPQTQLNSIEVILEAKAYSVDLDKPTGPKERSPHEQLMEYLRLTRKTRGFLTDGRYWRFYDLETITREKAYFELDLEAVLHLQDRTVQLQAMAVFRLLFGHASFIRSSGSSITPIEDLYRRAAQFASEAEENLKAVIYGTDGENSLFELLGRAIHARSPNAPLDQVYDNAIVMLFRLLFIVYFEDRNHDLLTGHPYWQYSLETIFDGLHDKLAKPSRYTAFFDLKRLFEILDTGAADIDVPLFNGGLFDIKRAALLSPDKLFDNATLKSVLERLRYKTRRGNTLFDERRDYANMSVTHLGRIYEGLLEFSFEVPQEDAVYLEYQIGKEAAVEAYFDRYDFEQIRKTPNFREIRHQDYFRNGFLLKSASNSRKVSASYYTPSSLSRFLVEKAIDHAILTMDETPDVDGIRRTIPDIKILDNACGSGHFLVEALNYLTQRCLGRLDEDLAVQQMINEERVRIAEQIAALNLEHYIPTDTQILKRALLKRCIFGVDLNLFAVELTRLSLWMDTFIFGTPLSFIEHHIQHGNALMGSSEAAFARLEKDFIETQPRTLPFDDKRDVGFAALEDSAVRLSQLRDTSGEDVRRSKAIFEQEIRPQIRSLARPLSFATMLAVRACEAEVTKNLTRAEVASRNKRDVATWFEGVASSPDPAADQHSELRKLHDNIAAYERKYNFFHFDVAFPEARRGFDVVIGNPPWDKTHFADTDFFPRWQSNYRTMTASAKKKVQQNLLAKPHIKQQFEAEGREILIANEFYKNHYPLSGGSGNGNIFRFFVERNLSLLATRGSLNYVLPSALMFEDGSKGLREHIFAEKSMPFFYSFENNKGIFPDVHRSYKFAMVQIRNQLPSANASIDTAFYVLDPDELSESRITQRTIRYPVSSIATLSPTYAAMMELRSVRDLPILTKCYKAFSPLSPAWLDFRNELNVTTDNFLFIEQQNKAMDLLPFYEGKMIWQFTDRYAEAQTWLDKTALEARLKSKEIARMAADCGLKRIDCERQHSDAIRYDREYFRLGFRDIARDTDERTLIFALFPRNCGVGNTISVSIPKRYELDEENAMSTRHVPNVRLLFAMAWFNAIPTDWIARFMIQIHANKTYLFRLPVPQPNDEDILLNPDYATLTRNALLLTLSNNWESFEELAPQFSIEKKDLPLTPKAYDHLRYANDVIVARLYGISNDDLRYIIKSFPVMTSKRPEYVSLFGR